MSVVDEPMEKEESETLAKKKKKIFLKEYASDILRSQELLVYILSLK